MSRATISVSEEPNCGAATRWCSYALVLFELVEAGATLAESILSVLQSHRYCGEDCGSLMLGERSAVCGGLGSGIVDLVL